MNESAKQPSGRSRLEQSHLSENRDANPGEPKRSRDGIPLVGLAEFQPAQRRVIDKIIKAMRRYYPTWHSERESIDEFYERWYDAPEIARFKAVIDRRVRNDRIWPVFLDDVKRALGRDFTVMSGTPPGFYVPAFILVITRSTPRDVTAVFRLSMLLPLRDYYEVIREPGSPRKISVMPQDIETMRIARIVHGLIAEHFPEYRAIPPDFGAVLVHDMVAENTLIGTTSLTNLLFSNIRNW